MRLQMIFAMMEKSTFDKNGIKRHEVASEFLTLFRFSICDIQTGLSEEKQSWGQSLTDDLSTFSQQQTRRAHFRAQFYEVAVFK